MSEITRIHDQLRRSHEGSAWHGPSLREVLDGTGEQLAALRGGNTHSIRELVRHIAAWEAIATQTLAGAAYPDSVPPELDWPPGTLETFEAELKELERAHRELETAVQAFLDHRLSEKVNGNRDFSYYVLLHGVIQHNIYHAGQIAILKKAFA